jgi:hypothetical protein
MPEEYVSAVAGTGQYTQPLEIFDRIPEFDSRSGDHLWTVVSIYRIDPVRAMQGTSFLDTENLICITGPGCYYCEKMFTPQLAKRRCTGNA